MATEAKPPSGRSREASAGLAIALATAVMAGASAVQAIAYLSRFGATQRTDAFFAAFALYTVFGIFTQSIRVTAVPLLVGDDRRLRGREFAVTLSLIAIPVLLACEPLASPLAHLLAPGVGASARGLTVDGLRILGGAMVLHLGAAGAATLLGVWDRFDIVARGYIVGALAGLIAYFAVVSSTGELALGWSLLIGAAVTAGWIFAGLQRARWPRPPLAQRRAGKAAADAGVVLARTLVYFVINGLYLVTLSFASSQSAGDATVLSYAYLFASYLVAGTGVAVGISRVPDMARGAKVDWSDVFADTVPHGFRYAMMVAAPAMAALVAAGAGLGGHLFPKSLPPGDVTTLRTFAALLVAWLVAALLVNFMLPALFALGRARDVNLLSLPVIALHLAATAAGAALFGVNGIVGALFVAPLAYGVVLLRLAPGRRRGDTALSIAGDSLLFVGLAAAAFGAGALFGLVVRGGAGRPVVAGVVGAVLYVAGLRAVAPRQFSVLLGGRFAG